MSEFASDQFGRPKRVRVRSVRADFLTRRATRLSALVVVPLAPMLGLATAARALRTPGEPRLRAALVLLIAAIGVAAQATLGIRGYQFAQNIHSGPARALNDSSGPLRDVVRTLEDRYGRITDVTLADPSWRAYIASPGQSRQYTVHCERADLRADVDFHVHLEADVNCLATRIEEIRIYDRDDAAPRPTAVYTAVDANH